MTEARHNIVIKLSEAAKLAGRDKNDITLIAVSKQQPDERIEESLASGQRVFGENRVQEAFERWQARKTEYPELQLLNQKKNNQIEHLRLLKHTFQELIQIYFDHSLCLVQSGQG